MKRICSWCLAKMGKTRDGQPGVTHGICGACLAKVLEEIRVHYSVLDPSFRLNSKEARTQPKQRKPLGRNRQGGPTGDVLEPELPRFSFTLVA